MDGNPAKDDLDASRLAITLKTDELADELRRRLGPRLVALIAGVKETRAVHDWAAGRHEMNEKAEQRLRLTYHVVFLLTRRDTDQVAQAWLQGLNPKLADRSPARLIRDGDSDEIGPQVLAAARAFAAIG